MAVNIYCKFQIKKSYQTFYFIVIDCSQIFMNVFIRFLMSGPKASSRSNQETRIFTQPMNAGWRSVLCIMKRTFNRIFGSYNINVFFLLKEFIGDPAGKLHTGRSRNDQVWLGLNLVTWYFLYRHGFDWRVLICWI